MSSNYDSFVQLSNEINECGPQSLQDVSIVDLAAIAECLEEVDSCNEFPNSFIDTEATQNPYLDSDPKRQIYLDKLWNIYIKHRTHWEEKNEELKKMLAEDNDVELTRKGKYIFLMLRVELQKLEINFRSIQDKAKDIKAEDVINFSKLIASFQKDIKSCEAHISHGLVMIEQSTDKNSPSYQKTEEVHEKLRIIYNDQSAMFYKLRQRVANMLDQQNDLENIEKKELKNELNSFSEKLRIITTSFDNAEESSELAIALSNNLSDQFEILMDFQNKYYSIKTETDELKKTLDEIAGRYEITLEANLARKIRSESRNKKLELASKNGLKIFKLPFKETHTETNDKLRSFELGEERLDKDHRYILLTGMTGSGKSLLVNNMINYVYGVSHRDKFRFKLIVESEEIDERGRGASSSQANSMTSWVTSFTLHWQDGFRIPYSLTIIDTPGFGDTRGLDYDEEIIGQLRKFFHHKDICPTQELSCIGLLIQASQARITEEQKYIFDQVLNLFGKDMSNNIFLIFTFADAQDPPALEIVTANKIPFAKGCTFKFNNSAVYASNENTMSQNAWDFGYSSLQMYFLALGKTEPVSLSLTKQVLNEREKLRLLLAALQAKISDGMDTLKQIEDQSRVIIALNGTIKANRNFKIKKQVCNCELQVVTHPITNCSKCNFTCHSPCAIIGDIKDGCAAMGENGMCEMCPSKCPFSLHTNGTNIYVYKQIEIEETVEDMLKEHNVAVGDKNAKKKLLQNMLLRYQKQKEEVFDSIYQANEFSNRLEKIALRNSFLNNVEYIERLIQSEERSSRPNKANRIKQFRHMKDMAEILRDAKVNPEALTGKVSAYETEIVKIIDNLEEDEDDCEKEKCANSEVSIPSNQKTGTTKSLKKIMSDTKSWFQKTFT